jgi:propionyl-CoA carboxylase beta chain
LPGDGVTGKGIVGGRTVLAYSQDFTVGGGAVGALHAAKIVECLKTALKCGVPVVGINDGGGARIQEGVESLAGYGSIFFHNTLLSGVARRSSLAPAGGGTAGAHFIIMVDGTATMFIAGPEVIKAPRRFRAEPGGAAWGHLGNIHFVAKTDAEVIEAAGAVEQPRCRPTCTSTSRSSRPGDR